jgi:hypothetical protein
MQWRSSVHPILRAILLFDKLRMESRGSRWRGVRQSDSSMHQYSNVPPLIVPVECTYGQPHIQWAHSMGIKGAFKKHSPRIQGTFRADSVRVERTPVSPRPNCKKQLKKSTKVDAEYNLQTRVPKTRVDRTNRRIPGVELRVHSHSASFIIIRADSGNIQGTFRKL